MTRIGRVFAPKYTPKVASSPAIVPPREKIVPTPPPWAGAFVPTTLVVTIVPSTKGTTRKVAEVESSKGKEMVNEHEQVEGHEKHIIVEEGQEFLKLIKKGDFKIVDKLDQTPSKISILSLLLSSEAHRKMLLKVLNIAHVMQDITID